MLDRKHHLELKVEIEHWNELEALENSELVHETLEQLSTVHREVLTLRFLEELGLSEIAESTA